MNKIGTVIAYMQVTIYYELKKYNKTDDELQVLIIIIIPLGSIPGVRQTNFFKSFHPPLHRREKYSIRKTGYNRQ